MNLFAARESRKAIASEFEKKSGARKLAAQILEKVDCRKAYADILLDHTLRSHAIVDQDRFLLTEIVYGTLRWRGRIDALLTPLVHRPLQEADPLLRSLLRLTVYQLVFLDRIPAYAALHEAVEIAKDYAGAKAGGFINGVLRRFLRDKDSLAKPNPDTSSTAALAQYWSHPDWLVQSWLRYIGRAEIEDLLRANNEEPPLVVRTNLRKGSRSELLTLLENEGIEAAPTSWSPQGITLSSRMRVNEFPGYHQGRFQVQGESSQLVTYLLAPQPGECILDACAAPGGKTTHIAEAMDDGGRVTALDMSRKGIERIRENAKRLGLRSILACQADVSRKFPRSLSGPYDRILIDAPCSGFGTLRSHPEIKWHRTQRDIQRLARLQQKIIHQAASHLRISGILVYSTCTLTEEENEHVVEAFLDRHKEFVLEAAAGYLPDQSKSLVRGGYFMTLPHRHNADGFFAARMRKVA